MKVLYKHDLETKNFMKSCLSHIDNDAARHAFISGTAKKGVAGILIDEVNFLEYVHGILPWYARVASC